MDENIAVIRVTGYGGCGCCIIFKAETDEKLQCMLKERLTGMLMEEDMSPDDKEAVARDKERIINFIENMEDMVEIETTSEQWEYLNSKCEFTQIEEETISKT